MVVRQRSSSSLIWLMFSTVHLDRVGSACSLSLMTVRALSRGTLVNSAVTSYDTSFCPGGTTRFCSFPTNSLVFLTLCSFVPTSGVRMLARYLAALYVILLQLECHRVSGASLSLGIISSRDCQKFVLPFSTS